MPLGSGGAQLIHPAEISSQLATYKTNRPLSSHLTGPLSRVREGEVTGGGGATFTEAPLFALLELMSPTTGCRSLARSALATLVMACSLSLAATEVGTAPSAS